MQVRCIDRGDAFDALESRWQEIWEADPHATIFLSWAWLKGWMATTDDPWVILAVGPRGTAPVALLPLCLTSGNGRFRLLQGPELTLAGAPMSDHAGLLCLPGYEERAFPALARAAADLVERTGAARLVAREVSDPRWDAFLAHFDGGGFDLAPEEPTPCPCIPLPETWSEYMAGSRKRKAVLRRAEREGYLVTHATDERLERYVDLFLDLHQLRMGARPPEYLLTMRSLLRWTHRAGRLHLVLLWHDGTPVAANVAFLDRPHATFHAYNGGWDEWYRKHSPRRILELHSIRCAIEEGYRTYDLGRGGEGYKFGFGAEERFNRNDLLVRRSAAATARRFAERVSGLLSAGGRRNGRDGSGAKDDRQPAHPSAPRGRRKAKPAPIPGAST